MTIESKINKNLKNQIKNIPSSSGVYMMLDKRGEVIYIGKALNLKSRVRSYLNEKSWSERPKLFTMMPKVIEIKTILTRSENEALMLEANLVNKHQPKYNVTLKDDKKFPWLMITYDEKYPRVLPIRDIKLFKLKNPKTKNKFFGPYSDSGAMWETYKLIKEGFQLRLRRKPLFKDRPCMNYHLGLCSGPCQELINYDDYQRLVKQVDDFLLGKYDTVLKNLNEKMNFFSKNLEYEKAAKYRDLINKINKVLEKQIVISSNSNLSQDIFACDFNDKDMVLEVLIIRDGKIITIETLPLLIPKETNFTHAFNEGIKQYYNRISNENIPSEILIQYEIEEKNQIENWLTSRINKKVKITHPKKGRKLELIKMAYLNAKQSLQRITIENINKVTSSEDKTLLEDLKNKLNLKSLPERIECFDISHLGGTDTVASMVVFVDGKARNAEYRKFKIKSLPDGKIDDFLSMREVIRRRYSYLNPNLPKSKNKISFHECPDLIIVDGGKGQLNAAKEELIKIGINLNKIDLISLAKKEEEVFKPDLKLSIKLERESEALHLIQRIRNEAHRFAITFQREKRKNIFKM